MYDPNEANKTYINLLKEKGMVSGIKSALLVITIYFFNKLVAQQDTSLLNIVFVYFFFCRSSPNVAVKIHHSPLHQIF